MRLYNLDVDVNMLERDICRFDVFFAPWKIHECRLIFFRFLFLIIFDQKITFVLVLEGRIFLAQRFVEILVNGTLSLRIDIYIEKISLALFRLLSFHKSAEKVAISVSRRLLFFLLYALICTVVDGALTIVGTAVIFFLRMLFKVVPIIGFINALHVDLGHSS